MSGYIATMSVERQEALEVEMAQRQAAIRLEHRRKKVEAERREKEELRYLAARDS